jgi:hypothetical protein
LNASIRRDNLNGVPHRDTHDYGAFFEGGFHASVDETRRYERSCPIVDNHDFTIRVQPRQPPAHGILPSGTPGREYILHAAEAGIRPNKLLTSGHLFSGCDQYDFMHGLRFGETTERVENQGTTAEG